MNFLEGMELSLSNSFNNSFLDEPKNIFPFSIDESDIPIIKEDKSSLSKNLFITKRTIKEKINHQKLLLEQKRGLTEKEKKEIYFDKKEDLKRRNRESAQKSRDKKKLEFMKIIEENKKLKDEIYIINSKINLLCSGCKTIFDFKSEEISNNNNICVNCSSSDNNNNNLDDINDNIINSPSTSLFFSNLKIQKLFNFILISLFTLFCIFGLISNIPNNNTFENKFKAKEVRNMKEIEHNKSTIINNNISRISDYFLKKNIFIETNKTYLKSKLDNKDKINNFKYEVCAKDFFTSFQCQKKSFLSKIDNDDNIEGKNNENNNENYFNNKNSNNKNSFSQNNNKNSIYFNLFVQSCSKDEGNINDNNSINDNAHYIFSSDNNMCQDFYFSCQRTEN